MFGSGFVAPNPIDFDYVFDNLDFSKNITIYATLIIINLLYLILLVWARRADIKDVAKVGASPMPDNIDKDKYLYEVTVYTGLSKSSATDSKVHFVLSGEWDETEIRYFADDNKKLFRIGAKDKFVMSVSRPLGPLLYLRIWHDNTGPGTFKSWFLKYIQFRDLQTNEKYKFIAEQWFAIEKFDGKTERILPVAGKDQLIQFQHLFQSAARKNLSDGHLWFSVFGRPVGSRFTRAQRLSCCLNLLYTSMLVSAMWYGVVPDTGGSSAVQVGPFTMSMEELQVAIMSNLIVFPINMALVTMFRKSKARKKRPSRYAYAITHNKVSPSPEAITKSKEDGSKPADAGTVAWGAGERGSRTAPGSAAESCTISFITRSRGGGGGGGGGSATSSRAALLVTPASDADTDMARRVWWQQLEETRHNTRSKKSPLVTHTTTQLLQEPM